MKVKKPPSVLQSFRENIGVMARAFLGIASFAYVANQSGLIKMTNEICKNSTVFDQRAEELSKQGDHAGAMLVRYASGTSFGLK